jgi:hypothetical protein
LFQQTSWVVGVDAPQHDVPHFVDGGGQTRGGGQLDPGGKTHGKHNPATYFQLMVYPRIVLHLSSGQHAGSQQIKRQTIMKYLVIGPAKQINAALTYKYCLYQNLLE